MKLSRDTAYVLDVTFRILCSIVSAYEFTRFLFLLGEVNRMPLLEATYCALIMWMVYFYPLAAALLLLMSVFNVTFIQTLEAGVLQNALMRLDSGTCMVVIIIVFTLNLNGIVSEWTFKRQ